MFDVTGQPGDASGMSVPITTVTHTPTVSKSMITNASFRTKKLPGECKNEDSCFITFRVCVILFFTFKKISSCYISC